MNLFTTLTAILVASATFAVADDGGPHTKSYTDRVTGGSFVAYPTYSFTNNPVITSAAYELKHVSFTIPSAAFTNVFTITNVRKYRLPQTQVSVVTTSDITSPITGSYEVRTNLHRYGTTTATFTNAFTVATTTNDITTQYYDTDDFPKGWSFEPGDTTTFGFTYTNVINLNRVYDVYHRP